MHLHETMIVVNGEERTVDDRELTFDEVVQLAFPNPPTGENVLFTITYRRGHGDKPTGSLVAGQTLKVKKGMIVDVTATDRS